MVATGIVMSLGTTVVAQSTTTVSGSSTSNKNSVKIKKSKYTASISASAVRGLDEFSEESAAYEGSVGMKINKDWSAGLTVGYSHPFDFDAERTDRWELEDVELSASRVSIWKSDSKKGNLSLGALILLPTSGTSSDSGMYSKVSVWTSYTHKVGRFTFGVTPQLVGAYHQFETTSESGFIKNSPLAVALGTSVGFKISKKWSLGAGAKVYSYFDYDFNNKNLQIFSGSLGYKATKKISLSLATAWRSRVITNNSLFDDDASSVSFTLTYSI